MGKKLLWKCPKCRRWLPQRNAVHVCAPPVPLRAHFRGKSPAVRQLFDALRAELNKLGPVRMDSTKTRIAFRVFTNFVELTSQKNALRGCLVLPRADNHPRFHRVISLSPRIHYHFFKLTDLKQIDACFRRLLAEAYKVGRREHLKKPLPKGRAFVPGVVEKRRETTHRRGRESGRQPRVATHESPVTSHESRPLWRCPKCGNYFVTRNLWHSCVRVPLDNHFQGKDAIVRQTFDALVAALRRNGPLRVVSSKTRITFMVRMRFAGVTPQKHSLPGGFALLGPARHPLLRPGLRYGRTYGYRFRLTHPKQIDPRFRRLLAEAYQVGQQKHLERPQETR